MSPFKRITTVALVVYLGIHFASAGPRVATYERENGSLQVTAVNGKNVEFDLEQSSNTGDQCEIEQKASQVGDGKYRFSNATGCILELSFKDDEVDVTSTEDCHSYCGVSAGIGDVYRIRPADCADSAMKVRRNQFKADYAKKKFKEGTEILKKLLNRCTFFLGQVEKGEMRSDLAVALLHSGDKEGCLEQIKAAREEDPNLAPENLAHLPENDHYNDLKRVARTLSFNEKKCSSRK